MKINKNPVNKPISTNNSISNTTNNSTNKDDHQAIINNLIVEGPHDLIIDSSQDNSNSILDNNSVLYKNPTTDPYQFYESPCQISYEVYQQKNLKIKSITEKGKNLTTNEKYYEIVLVDGNSTQGGYNSHPTIVTICVDNNAVQNFVPGKQYRLTLDLQD